MAKRTVGFIFVFVNDDKIYPRALLASEGWVTPIAAIDLPQGAQEAP